jgi:hypothetical protein
MKQFILHLSTGESKTVVGNNMIDAFLQSGGTPENFKSIVSYQESSGPITRFSS